MLKISVFCFALFCARSSVESLQGTVCKYYDDIKKADSCSGQRIVVENKQDLISKSSISQIVHEAVEKNLYVLQRKIDNLTKSLESITGQNSLKGSKSCSGGMIYENQCIKIPSCTYADFQEANETCNNMSSTLAEITSVAMYHRVYTYLLSTMNVTCSGMQNIRVWLGSTFEKTNNDNNEITLRNGSKVLLRNWYPGYPHSGSRYSTYINLIMRANSVDGSPYKGIYNSSPSLYGNIIPLCSYYI